MRPPEQEQSRPDKHYTDAVIPPAELRLRPIGVVRSPHKERFAAPRQPGGTPTPHAATATIELRDDLADATRDLACFSHIWLIYWLHLNRGWNPLVRPPGRGGTPRGLLATRAPHRPNPIGLSALRLIACDRTNLTVEAGDLLDGTPVLDIKPYLPYCDRIDQANSGWLQPPSPSAPHGVRS